MNETCRTRPAFAIFTTKGFLILSSVIACRQIRIVDKDIFARIERVAVSREYEMKQENTTYHGTIVLLVQSQQTKALSQSTLTSRAYVVMG